MAATPGSPPSSSDWASHLTDRIVGLIDRIRDKTTSKIEFLARVLVYGVVVLVLGSIFGILFVILGLRVAYNVAGRIPWFDSKAGRPVWFVDLALGLLLTMGGLALQRKGRPKSPK